MTEPEALILSLPSPEMGHRGLQDVVASASRSAKQVNSASLLVPPTAPNGVHQLVHQPATNGGEQRGTQYLRIRSICRWFVNHQEQRQT